MSATPIMVVTERERTETPFTLLDACTRSIQAQASGIVPEHMGNAFAYWLADTYRDELAEYVDELDTSTLFGRFLAAQVTR